VPSAADGRDPGRVHPATTFPVLTASVAGYPAGRDAPTTTTTCPVISRRGSLLPAPHDDGARADLVVGQAGASASCTEAANASGPRSTAAGSIHMTCQPWPSRSKKLREYMKP
jgi:hypothetical protein